MSTSSQTEFKREHLPDILRYITKGQTRGRLALTDGVSEALIYCDSGQILAARCGSLGGIEVLRNVLAWTSGHLEFMPEPVSLSSLPEVIWVNLPVNDLLAKLAPSATPSAAFVSALSSSVPATAPARFVVNVNSVPRLIQRAGGVQIQVAPATVQLFPYLDGTQRIGHISQATGLTFSTIQVLLQPLLESGYLELIDAPVPSPKTTKVMPAPVAPSPLPDALSDDLERVVRNLVGPFGGVLLEEAAEGIGSDIDALTVNDAGAWLTALEALLPVECRSAFQIQARHLQKQHLTVT